MKQNRRKLVDIVGLLFRGPGLFLFKESKP
jgi:hypothetical protein